MRGTRRSALRNQALCGVVIRSTVGSQSIPGGNFRIRCFFAIWAFVGCAGGGEALQPLLALEDDDFDHDDDYRYGDDGFVAPAPVKAGHVREIHAGRQHP